jgi:hypothetical protein
MSDTTIVYNPSDEEILQLQKQVTIETTIAKDLLQKHNGNMLDAILEAYSFDQSSIKAINNKSFDVESEDLTIDQKLSAFRNILDEKDAVFQKNIAKDIDLTGVREIEYVMFDHSTKVYTRYKINNTKQIFIDDVVRPFLTPSSDEIKIIQKYVGEDAKKSLSVKWGFTQSVILYIDSQNSLHPANSVNQLATTLMKKAKYLTDNEEFKGPCIIVNKWF